MRIQKKEKPLNANLMYDSSLNIVSEFKPGFLIVVSVVSVVRKKFIRQIEFILSCTTCFSCRFCCIEHLYGTFP